MDINKIANKFTLIDVAKVFLTFLILYLILVIHYIKFVNPIFSGDGFDIEISITKIFYSIFFLLYLSLLFYGLKINKSSTHLFNIMIFLSIIPMLVLYSLQNLNTFFILYVIISITIIRFILNIRIEIRIKLISLSLLKIIVIFFIIFLIIWLLILNWKYFNLNILKVYEYRCIISANTPFFLSYLYNILFKGLVPILFLFFLFYEKSYANKSILSVLILFIYILIFALTSHKFYLFIIPFLILVYLFFRKSKNISLNILFIFIIFLFLLIFVNTNETSLVIKSLFIRRVIFLPAELNFKYYKFFSQNPFVFFTDSKFIPLSYFFSYPYDLDIAHLIGREIFNNSATGANTSWIGSGYAHAGFLGMILYAIIIGILFKYLDYLSKYLGYRFIIVSFSPYIIILFLSSDLKTVFLTHGLIFYLIMLNILTFHKEKVLTNGKSLPYLNRSSSF